MISPQKFSQIIGIFIVVILSWEIAIIWGRLSRPQMSANPNPETTAVAMEAATEEATPSLTVNKTPTAQVKRASNLITIASSNKVVEYVVQPNDTISSLANYFGVTESTIVGGNVDELFNNVLKPGMKINILPVSGVYYTWINGDTPLGVATYFGVNLVDIIRWNQNLDINNISVGQKVIIPGATLRNVVGWEMPKLSSLVMEQQQLANQQLIWRFASDQYTGSYMGYPYKCKPTFAEFRGTGSFIWPVADPYVSGNDFVPELGHPGVDLGVTLGQPVLAIDGGFVVYAEPAGPYGNLVVIDHNNGWKSFYAHLNSLNVACGDFVMQGAIIGGGGTTGNSTGPHLHFELIDQNDHKVNPFLIISRQ